MPIILGAQEAEIRMIAVQSQPGQIVLVTLSGKSHSQQRAARVAQGVGPELKLQYHKNKYKISNKNKYQPPCPITQLQLYQLMASSLISHPLSVHLTQVSCKIFHNLHLGPNRSHPLWLVNAS
jgi:hypothetical protein